MVDMNESADVGNRPGYDYPMRKILAVFHDKAPVDHFLWMMRDLFRFEQVTRRRLRSGNIEVEAAVVHGIGDAHRFAGVDFIDIWWCGPVDEEARAYLTERIRWQRDHTHHSLDDGL